MLSEQIKNSSIDAPQQILNNINEYFIKIDYFDQKGSKSFENNIPLRSVFNNNANLPINFKVWILILLVNQQNSVILPLSFFES